MNDIQNDDARPARAEQTSGFSFMPVSAPAHTGAGPGSPKDTETGDAGSPWPLDGLTLAESACRDARKSRLHTHKKLLEYEAEYGCENAFVLWKDHVRRPIDVEMIEDVFAELNGYLKVYTRIFVLLFQPESAKNPIDRVHEIQESVDQLMLLPATSSGETKQVLDLLAHMQARRNRPVLSNFPSSPSIAVLAEQSWKRLARTWFEAYEVLEDCSAALSPEQANLLVVRTKELLKKLELPPPVELSARVRREESLAVEHLLRGGIDTEESPEADSSNQSALLDGSGVAQIRTAPFKKRWIIDGREMPLMTRGQHKAMIKLAEARGEPLDLETLKDGNAGARDRLRELVQSDEDWERVIARAGFAHQGYKLNGKIEFAH